MLYCFTCSVRVLWQYTPNSFLPFSVWLLSYILLYMPYKHIIHSCYFTVTCIRDYLILSQTSCVFYSVLFTLFLPFCVSVFVISIDLYSESLLLSSAVSCLLVSLWKAFFISVSTLFISFHLILLSLWIFDEFSICSCILLMFSTKVFNILIIVILTSLFDSSNIWVTSESGSLDYFVSRWFMVFFSLLCVSHNFCLKAGHLF